MIARVFYSVKAEGLPHIPKEGGALLVPNHVTWVDALVLQLACPRPIRFVVFQDIYNQPLLKPIFQLVQAIPISATRAKEGMKDAVDRIERGEIICIFPEGELSRRGILLKLKKGFQVIARKANAPVIPVFLDRLWGSIFSFERGKFFFKWPRKWPYPVMVAFGEPIPSDKADIALVRERLQFLGEECYQERPILKEHIGRACIRGLKKSQWSQVVVDGMDHSSLTGGNLLAAGLALAKYLRGHTDKKRIAVILPPGKAAIVANLGIMLAGKVPVNLNFSAGREAITSAIRRGDIQSGITAKLVTKRLADFPWPEETLYMDEIVPPLKKSIITWRMAVALFPHWILASLIGVPSKGGHEEGVLLFTSGSSGEPKGVVLSHRNILSNVMQFGELLNLSKKDSVLASLPFFHSFGCTVTLWFPMIEGVRVVSYPSPLEVGKNAELIQKYGVTVMLATPTFLRGYLKKATPEQLKTLNLVVVGAEKLPKDIATAFKDKFGVDVMEGYGLTETAPVAAVNLPDPLPWKSDDAVQPSYRPGSVGRLAPGIAAQIREPETGAPMSLHDTGMLWVKGPNIFEGYLHEEKRTAEVLIDGWFKTGDLARFDDEGFLYIEGRLSRFSKIAGEMVPHETVEAKINEAYGFTAEGDRTVAITGVPDEAKGEALVLLTTKEINAQELRKRLTEAELPNLWIPRVVRQVETIPVLATGKLDLKRVKELAMELEAQEV